MSAKIADELRAKANSSFDRLATISELMLRAADALDALEAERDGLLDKLDARISMHHDIEQVLDDTFAALREIAWSRPLGPTRSKAVERLERIAIDALGAASSPNKEDRNG